MNVGNVNIINRAEIAKYSPYIATFTISHTFLINEISTLCVRNGFHINEFSNRLGKLSPCLINGGE